MPWSWWDHPVGDRLTLPCGCVLTSIGDTFVIQPCDTECRWYAYALAESVRQHKPIQYVTRITGGSQETRDIEDTEAQQ